MLHSSLMRLQKIDMMHSLLPLLNILASRNHDSGVTETNILDTETTFD